MACQERDKGGGAPTARKGSLEEVMLTGGRTFQAEGAAGAKALGKQGLGALRTRKQGQYGWSLQTVG